VKNFYKKIDFSFFSSIKIGKTFEVLIINELDASSKLDKYKDFYILGKASNLLISDNPPKLAMLGSEFSYIKQENNLLFVGASTGASKLAYYAKKNNIANLEFIKNLPGTLGGLVKMNAGLKEYEIFSYLEGIKTAKGYVKKENLKYSYRKTNIKDIIYEVVFKLDSNLGYSQEKENMFKKMRKNQPKVPSAGSCFKNPKNGFAGEILDRLGLKGFKVGDMSFSEVHANFLVNNGKGTFAQALTLINLAKQKAKEELGIDLELEIIIL